MSTKTLAANLLLGVMNRHIADRDRELRLRDAATIQNQSQQFQLTRDQQDRGYQTQRDEVQRTFTAGENALNRKSDGSLKKWEPANFDEWKEMKEFEESMKAKYKDKSDKNNDGPDDQQSLNYVQDMYGSTDDDLRPYADAYKKGGADELRRVEGMRGKPKPKKISEDEIATKAQKYITPWNAWYRNETTRKDRYGTLLTGENVPPIDPRTKQPITQDLVDAVADVAARNNMKPEDAVPVAVALQVADFLADSLKVDDTTEEIVDGGDLSAMARSMGIPLDGLGDGGVSVETLASLVALGIVPQDKILDLVNRTRQAPKSVRGFFQGQGVGNF